MATSGAGASTGWRWRRRACWPRPIPRRARARCRIGRWRSSGTATWTRRSGILVAAFDLGPATGEVLGALEKLYERRDDWRGLRQRLQARVGAAAGAAAGKIWSTIGRASERLGDVTAAEFAFTQARDADPADAAPLTALRRLAVSRRDWAAVSALLEKEIERVRGSERVELLVQHGLLLADKLSRAGRAVEVLEAALDFQPSNAAALQAMFEAALAAGMWEKAGQALEATLSAATIPDAAERYHRVGRAAEAEGKTRSRARLLLTRLRAQPARTAPCSSGCRRSASIGSSGTTPGRRPSTCWTATAPTCRRPTRPSWRCGRRWPICTSRSAPRPWRASRPCRGCRPPGPACATSPIAGPRCASTRTCWAAWTTSAGAASCRA